LNYVPGDVVPNGVIAPVSAAGTVCFYSQSDTDLVVDIAGWFSGTAFLGVTPQRLVDTRDGTGAPLARVTAAAPLVISVAGLNVTDSFGFASNVPSDVSAVALNMTVVNPPRSGFLTVWPCDTARPLASNVNYTASQIVANGVIAPVSAQGTVCVYSQSPTDVVVDLAGWFSQTAFTGTTPTRLVDTRDGTGGQTGRVTSSAPIEVPVHGLSLMVDGLTQQVPGTATAAALNVTIVDPLRSGFATVWPCSAARPLASNLNFVKGQIVANNVVAPIGDSGSICVFTSVSANVIVDISGWFSGDATNAFVGSTPVRFVDTRDALGPIPQ